MNILITAPDNCFTLGIALADRLGASPLHTVRVLHAQPGGQFAAEVQEWQGDLVSHPRIQEFLMHAMQDMDAVVNLHAVFEPRHFEAEAAWGLDYAILGTYTLIQTANRAGIRRFVQGSTLRLFDRLPAHWQVTEMWRPRPTPHFDRLLPWLGELSVKEWTRRGAMQTVCLRFGDVVDAYDIENATPSPSWVHVDDAVHAVERALFFEADKVLDPGQPEWHVFHVMAAGARSKIKHRNVTGPVEERLSSASPPFLYRPQVDFASLLERQDGDDARDARSWQEVLAPPAPVASRPIRKVIIFGAGGPMGASAAHALHRNYALTLADIHPTLDEATARRRAAGDPDAILPPPLQEPHVYRSVDVRDHEQVLAACKGMDAIINVSVNREHPEDSFRVSTVGAYNMVRAAVAHGIRRFVQTGPLLQLVNGHGSHLWDYRIPVDAGSRPYENLYFHSKYLGQEILRVFAEYHDLEVAVMLFWELVHVDDPHHNPPFFVSWPDAGRALKAALEVPTLPSPYEQFNVSVDLPHGKFDHRKIRDVLGWEPADSLEHFWQDAL